MIYTYQFDQKYIGDMKLQQIKSSHMNLVEDYLKKVHILT